MPTGTEEYLFNFGSVFVFLIFGCLFVALNLVLSRILQTRNPHPTKLSTYECGEIPVGGGWIQFNIRFYVIALIFLIFEVEIVFLFPWAVVFKKLGLFAFVEMMIFVFILLVGLAYVWAKGDLEWDKPEEVPDPNLSPLLVEEELTEEYAS
ncbi:MAG: NADH-quinone oxidoreductase subunit A [bacterium]